MKIKKIKSEFPVYKNIEIRDPSGEEFEKAEEISKKTGIGRQSVLISLCCTFDGKALPPEDVAKLKGMDFLTLSAEVLGLNPETLKE